jgi:hypothetical protein
LCLTFEFLRLPQLCPPRSRTLHTTSRRLGVSGGIFAPLFQSARPAAVAPNRSLAAGIPAKVLLGFNLIRHSRFVIQCTPFVHRCTPFVHRCTIFVNYSTRFVNSSYSLHFLLGTVVCFASLSKCPYFSLRCQAVFIVRRCPIFTASPRSVTQSTVPCLLN